MIYFIGIKGVGMTALAQVLQAQGYHVLGSDVNTEFMTDEILKQHSIEVRSPFSKENLPPAQQIEYCIVSGAYYQKGNVSSNIEVQSVIEQGVPILTYSEALGLVSQKFHSIGIAGSHGKTTTSAMLTYCLQELGENPFGVIGSVVPQFGGNARIGNTDSRYLVLEADEYQDHFLDFHLQSGFVLNIHFDHPDFFPNPQLYQKSFCRYMENLVEGGTLVVNGDDAMIQNILEKNPSIMQKHRIVTFGLQRTHEYSLDGYTIMHQNKILGSMELAIPGQHNRLNALAVFSFLHSRGYSVESILHGLSQFRGTKRRLEYKGEGIQGTILIDDYAHHPDEIVAGLQALRERYSTKTIHCVFQPHTFSRTEALLKDFAASFSNADYAYILPIYQSARETQGSSVSSKDMLQYEVNKTLLHGETFEEIIEMIKQRLGDNDIIVTMGAGDVWKLLGKFQKQ